MKKEKRIPEIDIEYNTKNNEIALVKYYDPIKERVTYTHNGNQYTISRERFMQMIPKEGR